MAKIEEITELLTEEIVAFQKSVEHLNKIQIKLLDHKIKIDLGPIQRVIDEGINKHDAINSKVMLELESSNKQIQNSISMPKWMIITVIAIIGFMILNFSYSLFLSNKVKTEREIGVTEGKALIIEHINLFFRDRPKTKKIYDNWLKEN